MKNLFYTKTLIATAVAIAAAAAAVSQAQEQPIPPPASTAAAALPADIIPGSPLADVVKMLQAGVDVNTIKSYIFNCESAFNLDADKILFLKDAGAPNDLIDAMLDRDKALYAASVAPPPLVATPTPAPTPAPDPALVATDPATTPPDSAPAPPDMTVDDFDQALSPYGSWVDIGGYGRCWRPTVAIYDAGWSPYCDRGHWTYTDYGWYWDSDYAWGVAFHYGRWFRAANFGWCWYPDKVWAPSWVIWRSDADYSGWAPLPPFAVFRPGVGFFYRGVSVDANFDFGLRADSFVFVASDHFFDRQPRSFRVGPDRVGEVFVRSAVVNHFDAHGRFLVNRGLGVEHLASVTHHAIEPVPMRELPNAGRQGWRGESVDRTLHPGGEVGHPGSAPGHAFGPGAAGGNELHYGAAPRNPAPVYGGSHPAETFHSPAQNPQPAAVYHQSPVAPQPGASTYHAQVSGSPSAVYHQTPASGQAGASMSHVAAQTAPAYQWQSPAPPVRSMAPEGAPPHEVVPSQPEPHEVSQQPVPRTQPAAPVATQGQAHNTGGNNNGSGNGNGH